MEKILSELKEISDALNVIILGYPIYKLALALAVILFSIFVNKLFLLIVIKSLKRFFDKTRNQIDNKLLDAIRKPLSFLFVIIGIYISFLILELDTELSHKILKALVLITIFWTIFNLVSTFEEVFYRVGEKLGREYAKEISSFVSKLVKIFLVLLALIVVLQEFGINVSALVASLGIGGLAVALAARDTVANLFGGITVLFDRAFRLGDWVKVGDVEGVVEDLGLRTTKVRTFEKSLVIVPNQMFATTPIENFSKRSVRRIKMYIGLTYDTTRKQIEKILEDIRNMLKEHPKISNKHTQLVYFTDFGESSLNIFIYCFTDTTNWNEYLEIKEDVNLKIMEIVERNGAEFAFPSISLYVEKLPNQEVF